MRCRQHEECSTNRQRDGQLETGLSEFSKCVEHDERYPPTEELCMEDGEGRAPTGVTILGKAYSSTWTEAHPSSYGEPGQEDRKATGLSLEARAHVEPTLP